MTLKRKTREELQQMQHLMEHLYDAEASIRRGCGADGCYRGDLIHYALVEMMETALSVGISIGLGRVRYRAVPLRQSNIDEMPRTA